MSERKPRGFYWDAWVIDTGWRHKPGVKAHPYAGPYLISRRTPDYRPGVSVSFFKTRSDARHALTNLIGGNRLGYERACVRRVRIEMREVRP